MASVAGVRRALEKGRNVWFTAALALAALQPLWLGEFGLLVALTILAFAILLAAEMARPWRAARWQDRSLAVLLYLLLFGPFLAIAGTVGWTVVSGSELTVEFGAPDAKDRWLFLTGGPPLVGILLAGGLLVPRRGRRREGRLYWAMLLGAIPLGALWTGFLEGPFLNIPGSAFIWLGVLLAFGLMVWRIYRPYVAPRKRSMNLYEPPGVAQAGPTGPSVEMERR